MALADDPDLLLQISDLSLSFGATKALDHVDLSIRPGVIHAVVGEHGAGKSTLAQIIGGFYPGVSGSMRWQGKPLSRYDRETARSIGVELVSQEAVLFENQNVATNLFINQNNALRGFIYDARKATIEAEAYLRAMEVPISAEAMVEDLNQSDQVLIDILRHLYVSPRLLILDESLEKLVATSFLRIKRHLEKLVSQGSSVLFITRHIDDIYDFADSVTVLKNGRVLTSNAVENIDKINLIRLAYTQINNRDQTQDAKKDFLDFLKFNEAILERLPINLLVVDTDGLIKLMNLSAADFFNIELSRILGDSLSSLLLPDNRATLESVSLMLGKKKGETLYNLSMNIGGRTRLVNSTVQPIMDGCAHIGSMIIFDDVTEQESLRHKIILSEKLASIGLLSAGVAHEINNPLETIYNYTDYLRQKTTDPGLLKGIAIIDEELESIKKIVSNLITFSYNSGAEISPVDLSALLTYTIHLVRQTAIERKIAVNLVVPPKEILVKADKTELKQVVLNLVRNSFEILSDGGTLSIVLECLTTEKGHWAKLQVEDSGPGISKEELNKIFDPFFSLKSNGHMGLGLSITYGIVAKYLGSIEVENLSPQGCRFTVLLPMLDSAD